MRYYNHIYIVSTRQSGVSADTVEEILHTKARKDGTNIGISVI